MADKQAENKLAAFLMEPRNKKEMKELLHDLLTVSEREEFATRIEIFKMLLDGKPQREIAAKLGVGIATVSRGSNALKISKIVHELLP